MKAQGTTLGADNGIAIALMLALAETPGLAHPALELLLTVEEEIGMTGATNLDPGLITGRTLINLDSEDEGVFTVGCCGGWTLFMHLPVTWEPAEAGWKFLSLRVDGVKGGHSGEDIHKGRVNANKLLGRALNEMEMVAPIRFAALKGGTVRNAIPREAAAVFAIPEEMETSPGSGWIPSRRLPRRNSQKPIPARPLRWGRPGRKANW